jgi:hypothetical protein
MILADHLRQLLRAQLLGKGSGRVLREERFLHDVTILSVRCDGPAIATHVGSIAVVVTTTSYRPSKIYLDRS